MRIWNEWFRCAGTLREACSRSTTFAWLLLVLAAMAVRPDLLGVSSFVRGAWLKESCYHLLLHLFHSPALCLSKLVESWVRLVFKIFKPVKVLGYTVMVADGLKMGKEGKKMPGVKKLHQESASNAKATYIMGHHFQVISLLVTNVLGEFFAVPLIARISEGVVFRRSKDKKTLLDVMIEHFRAVTAPTGHKCLLVADAYYSSRKVILPLLDEGHHLLTRCRGNSVAYHEPSSKGRNKRGRPRKYGKKVRLRNLYKAGKSFTAAPSPVYGEKNVIIQFRTVDLIWRPIGTKVRFILVKHPIRGNIILLSSCLELAALDAIKLYGLRFKIEVSFKEAVHNIGTYAYHFWMKPMKKIRHNSGDQYVDKKPPQYVKAVKRKLDAYHRYVQISCIVHGLLLHLAINFRDTVWIEFKSWLRTMKRNATPSVMVTSSALKSTFPQFLKDKDSNHEHQIIIKFILERTILDRIPGLREAV